MPVSPDTIDRALPGSLPTAAASALITAGLDLFGVLDVARYDALVPPGWQSRQQLPAATSAWVIGSGGDAMAQRALAAGGSDPVDLATSIAGASCVRALGDSGHQAVALHAFERRDVTGSIANDTGRYADFVSLAREAGLGAPSRLRVLVHPEYGPWMAIRSVVLTTAKLTATARIAGFSPCDGCAAPCQEACPAGALSRGDLVWETCRAERLRGGSCASRCAARRACVFGRLHVYGDEVEAHFMRNSLRMITG